MTSCSFSKYVSSICYTYIFKIITIMIIVANRTNPPQTPPMIYHLSEISKVKMMIYACLFVWWCLTPLSTIFQLYRGGQFYWWMETGETGVNHRPVSSHWQTLWHNVVHLALMEIRTHNISGDRHWLHR
jgi:hypothetical protein